MRIFSPCNIVIIIVRSHWYHHNYSKNQQRSSRIICCFVVKYLKNTIDRANPLVMFKYTKNELHHKYFPRFFIGYYLCFTICRNFRNACFTELLATGFYWLPEFPNKIKATRYSIVESCSMVNQNIVKTKVKFKINHASMNDYNYGKLGLSLKVFPWQIC